MPIDPKLLDLENPSRRSIDKLRAGRKRFRPWDDLLPQAPEGAAAAPATPPNESSQSPALPSAPAASERAAQMRDVQTETNGDKFVAPLQTETNGDKFVAPLQTETNGDKSRSSLQTETNGDNSGERLQTGTNRDTSTAAVQTETNGDKVAAGRQTETNGDNGSASVDAQTTEDKLLALLQKRAIRESSSASSKKALGAPTDVLQRDDQAARSRAPQSAQGARSASLSHAEQTSVQTETNGDNPLAPKRSSAEASQQDQTETNGDKRGAGRQTETNGDERDARRQTETNGDKLGLPKRSRAAEEQRAQTETNGDRTQTVRQTETNGDKTQTVRQTETNGDKTQTVRQTETNGDKRPRAAQLRPDGFAALDDAAPGAYADSALETRERDVATESVQSPRGAVARPSREPRVEPHAPRGPALGPPAPSADTRLSEGAPWAAYAPPAGVSGTVEPSSAEPSERTPGGPRQPLASIQTETNGDKRGVSALAVRPDNSPFKGGSEPQKSTFDKQDANGDKGAIKRRQTSSETETNGDKVPSDPRSNGDNKRRQTETRQKTRLSGPLGSLSRSLDNDGDDTENARSEPLKRRQTETNEDKTAFVSVSDDDCLRLNDELSPLKQGPKRRQGSVVSVSDANCLRLQTETTNGDKRRQESPLPTGAQPRAILLWLAKEHLKTGLDHTPRIQRQDIAAALNIPFKSVAKQIDRLIKAGLIRRIDVRKGRGEAGAVFQIPGAARVSVALGQDALNVKRRQETETNGDNKRRQQTETSDVVSSLYTSTTTTTNQALNDGHIEHLKNLVDRFRLDLDFEVGVNELKAIYKSTLLDPNKFAESVEHLAFYLRSPQAAGITHARAWFSKMLREGYYDEPVGFVSWEDHQVEAQLRNAKAKLERLQKLKKDLFDTEYSAWFTELTPEKIQAITRGTPLAGIGRVGLRACLRTRFADDTGRELPEEYADTAGV